MPERKPFPHIPRFPEEPKLEGAPHYAHESKLLEIEEGLPLLYEAGRDIRRFSEISKRAKQKEFQSELCGKLIAEPERFEEYIDTLRVLEERWEEKKGEVSDFTRLFLDNLERYVREKGSYTSETLKKWIDLSARSSVYKEAAEKILRALYERAKEPKQTIDFLYEFTQAILESEDKEVFERGLEILSFTTDVFKQESRGEMDFLKATFSEDDEIVRKQQEVDAVIWYFGERYKPEEYKNYVDSIRELSKREEYLRFIDERIRKDSERVKTMISFIERGGGGRGFASISHKQRDRWPHKLFFQQGEVRRLFNERVSMENEEMISISLPEKGSMMFKGEVGVIQTILEELRKEPKGGDILQERSYVKSLFYLSPELSKELQQVLADDAVLLRKEIQDERRHLISPRGDKMIIVSPELQAFGFKSILFEQGKPKTRLKATVEVENYKFVLEINKDLGFEESGTGKSFFVSFGRRAFFEEVLLNHLKELQCAERKERRIELGEEEVLGGTADAIEREKEFTSRRAHLRKLPQGKSYTQSQFHFALADADINLERLNREKGLTKEEGQITFIKAVEEVLIGRKGPLVSRAPRAMERYRNIIEYGSNH